MSVFGFPTDTLSLLCPWSKRRTEELSSSQDHGLPVMDVMVCGGSIIAILFVFSHYVAEVDWIFL